MYTDPTPQRAPCAVPTPIAEITPKGEALYSSLIESIFETVKSGCLPTVIRIGTRDKEIKIETYMNKVALLGSAKFKNNCPIALPPMLIII